MALPSSQPRSHPLPCGHPWGSWWDWDPSAQACFQPALASSCTTRGTRPAGRPWTGLKSAGPPPTCAAWDEHTNLTIGTGMSLLRGVPGGTMIESTCQCRTRGFNLQVGKIPWSRKCQPAPVSMPGKSHGQRSLVGYSPTGSWRVGHDWASENTCTISCMNGPTEEEGCLKSI